MKSHSLLLCFLLFVATTTTSFALGSMRGTGSMPGGWSPIKDFNNDSHVKEIALYAVKEINSRSKTDLKLQKIVSGESQVVSGVNYRLVLLVNGGASKKYEAIVWEKPWAKFMNLTSFKPIKG